MYWHAIVSSIADYKFEFVTGDDTAAATDAQVYVTMSGIVGEHTFYFNGSGSAFSVGGSDTFEQDGPAVGKLGADTCNFQQLYFRTVWQRHLYLHAVKTHVSEGYNIIQPSHIINHVR